jgi:hypothetical protein
MKRLHYLFLIALGCAPSGCSILIMNSGKKIEDCNTRDEVRNLLGEPEITGIVESQEFDEFFTHAKIAEASEAGAQGMGVAMTMGVFEIICTPYQGYRALRNMIGGQRIRVFYDPDGRVHRFQCDRLKLYRYPIWVPNPGIVSPDGPEDESSRQQRHQNKNAGDVTTGPDFYPTWLHAKEPITEPQENTHLRLAR